MNKPQDQTHRSTSSTQDDRTRTQGDRSRDELDETSSRHASPKTDDRESGNKSRQQR
jgi:hypothetical protein